MDGSVRRGVSKPEPTVALVPWGTPLEVFLDPLGRTLDDFCERLAGGWLFGYAEALAAVGYRPSIVVSSSAVAAREDRVHVATGTRVVVLPWTAGATVRRRSPGLRRDLADYRRAVAPGLLRVLAEHDAVVVQEYEEPRADLLAWWGVARRRPVFASFQGGMAPWESAPLQRLLRPASLRRHAGLLIGPRQEVTRLVSRRRVDARRVHRVANPVDTEVWRPEERAAARRRLGLPPEALVVAWHGRVDLRRKGLDVLVAAWEQVCAALTDADVRLLLVGSGADAEQLHEHLRSAAVRGVSWCQQYASSRDIRERLAACDLWVSSSRHEGFAVAPLEAMASGRPVVITDVPGSGELLASPDSDAGAVVPPGDPGALAAAILARLADRPSLESAGRAARKRAVDGFSIHVVARQLDAALSGALR